MNRPAGLVLVAFGGVLLRATGCARASGGGRPVATAAPAQARRRPPRARGAARTGGAAPAAGHGGARRVPAGAVPGTTGGTRDPFESLVQTNRVGPMIEDLRVVSIAYDARYGNSVAVIRAARDTKPIRVRRGDSIGNMRVIQIRQYEVVFQIEEFGFERQQVLVAPTTGGLAMNRALGLLALATLQLAALPVRTRAPSSDVLGRQRGSGPLAGPKWSSIPAVRSR